MDQTCAGGTPEQPCARPAEANSVTGGYGLVIGLNDHSTSRRQQYAAGFTLYEGDHEIKAGGDYQDGRTDVLGFYTGGQLVSIRNEYGPALLRPPLLCGEPRGSHGRTGLPAQRPGARLRRLPSGLLEGGAGPDDQRGASLGRRADAQLRGRDRPALRRTSGSRASAWSGTPGETARRRSTPSPAASPTPCRRWPRPVVRQLHDPRDLQLRSGQRDAGPERDRPREGLRAGPAPSETPVDPGVRGWYQDELTVGIERLLGPTLTVGLKGTYRTLAKRPRRSLRPRLHQSRDRLQLLRAHEPGLERDDSRAGTFPTCNGLDGDSYECGIDPGPATPPVSRIYRGIELFARKSLGDQPLAPGELRLLVPARQLRRRRQPGRHQGSTVRPCPGSTRTSTIPRCGTTGTGSSPSTGPTASAWMATGLRPGDLSLGLQAFVESGAPLNRLGYFNEVYRRVRLSRSARLGGPAADALGDRPDALLPDRDRPGDRDPPGVSLQRLQQADRDLARRGVVQSTAARAIRPRSTIRTRSRTTPSTARSPAAPTRASSAPRFGFPSDSHPPLDSERPLHPGGRVQEVNRQGRK